MTSLDSLPLRPPLQPMLARLERALPEGEGWVYEPKWDGFRCLVFRSGGDVALTSRHGRRLERYFPAVVDALGSSRHLPAPTACSGPVVAAAVLAYPAATMFACTAASVDAEA